MDLDAYQAGTLDGEHDWQNTGSVHELVDITSCSLRGAARRSLVLLREDLIHPIEQARLQQAYLDGDDNGTSEDARVYAVAWAQAYHAAAAAALGEEVNKLIQERWSEHKMFTRAERAQFGLGPKNE